MLRPATLLAACAVFLAAPARSATPEPLRLPALAPTQKVPAITIDCSGAPDLAAYAARARARCEAWYPAFVKLMASEGYEAPKEFLFVFKEMDGVAGTSGTRVDFSAKFFRENPDDHGAAIHEMAHIIQSYPHYRPGWLVESIADYARFYLYEPVSARPKPNPDKTTYRNGYREGAAFLAWIVGKNDRSFITKMNAALRQNTYNDGTWKQLTGKTLDENWNAYLADLRKNRTAAR